jgi:RNA polymerase sigma factor (sigma-70 family)
MRDPIATLFQVGALGGLDDAQLLDLFLGRPDAVDAAFAALVERHGPMVLRVCRSVLRDPDEASDAFQTTFLMLVRRAKAVRKRASVGSWLFGVALRVARRMRRSNARRLAREQEAARRAGRREWHSGDEDPADCPELFEEIERLPEAYRLPVLLCYLEGLSTEEAARRLGCPKGTVLSRLSRARDRLRDGLTRRGVVPAVVLESALRPAARVMPGPLVEATAGAALRVTAGGGGVGGTAAAALARRFSMRGAAAATLVVGAGLAVAALTGPWHDARRPRNAPVVRRSPAVGLDTDFGRRGIAVIDPPQGVPTWLPAGAALQPDGKVIVVSAVGPMANNPRRLVLARYQTDGALDRTFGVDGYVEAGITPGPDVGAEPDRPRVVVQADRKILLGATHGPDRKTMPDLAIQRFRPDGTTDPTFASGRPVLVDVGFLAPGGGPIQHTDRMTVVAPDRVQQTDLLTGLAVQSDGKIVVGGTTLGPPEISDAFSLVRLLPDGSLDESFGDRGRVTTTFPFPFPGPNSKDLRSTCMALDLALGPGGRIALAGKCHSPMRHWDIALAVYDADGRLDPAFDGGRLAFDVGIQWDGGPWTDDEAHAVAFAPDGSMLVAGSTTYRNPGPNLFLARLDPSGRLDLDFGAGGVSMDGINTYGRVRSIALQGDGKILVAGATYRDPDRPHPSEINRFVETNFVLARFRSDGLLDADFGDRGVTRTGLGGGDEVESLLPLPDGSLIAVGHSHVRRRADFESSLVLLRHRPR